MKRLRVVARLAVIAFLLGFVPVTVAHYMEYTGDISGTGTEAEVVIDHNDQDPWKGWADITVTNTGDEDWGDFHVLVSYGAGVFIEDSAPNQPSTDITGATWTMDGTTKVDFEFYGNPVNPGESANFQVYTNNTTNQNNWFGLTIYPTPVPEPTTIALLGFGAASLVMRRKK